VGEGGKDKVIWLCRQSMVGAEKTVLAACLLQPIQRLRCKPGSVENDTRTAYAALSSKNFLPSLQL